MLTSVSDNDASNRVFERFVRTSEERNKMGSRRGSIDSQIKIAIKGKEWNAGVPNTFG